MSRFTQAEWVAGIDLLGHYLGDREIESAVRWKHNALIAIEKPYWQEFPHLHKMVKVEGGFYRVRIVRVALDKDGFANGKEWMNAVDCLSPDVVVWKKIHLPGAGRTRWLWRKWIGQIKIHVCPGIVELEQVKP